MFLSFNNVIDEIDILQIKSWDSTYRFAASLPPDATAKKGCSIAEGFYLLHFPLDISYVRVRLFTQTFELKPL